MTDYKWKGSPKLMSDLLYQEDGKTLKDGIQVIGPRVLDGVAYANIRTDAELGMPDGVSETGPELSDAVVGVWFDPDAYKDAQESTTAHVGTALNTPTPTQETKKD